MAKETITKKVQVKVYATAAIKVAIALTLLLGALNMGGYVALGALTKDIVAGVMLVIGVWILLKNAA